MQKGNEANAIKSAFGGRVGHTSLQVIENFKQTLYISFWPSKTPSSPIQPVKAQMSSSKRDIDLEGGNQKQELS